MDLHSLFAFVLTGLMLLGLVPFVFGMAFSGEAIDKVRQRCFAEARTVGSQMMIEAFFRLQNQRGNPDLQFVGFEGLETADKVIVAGAGRVWMLFLKKPSGSTVTAYLKGSDHATVAAAAAEVALAMDSTEEHCLVFSGGLAQTVGFTIGSHTTASGNTKSAAADAIVGFAVISAAA